MLSYTIDEAINNIGFGRYQWLLMFVTGLSWVADAMEMMLLSFLGPVLKCLWALTPHQESVLTLVVFIGMALGNNFWGYIADRSGRKIAVIWCSLFIVVYGMLTAFCNRFDLLCAMRFMVGFGSGGVHVAFALFLEFVPAKGRGLWSSIMQGWWTIGTLAQAVMAMLVIPTLGWRYLVFFSALPTFLFLLAVVLVLESPRYLLSVGRIQETVEVLERAALRNGKELPPGEIATSAAAQTGSPIGLEDLTDSDDDDDTYIPSAAEQAAAAEGGVQFPSVTAPPRPQKNFLKSLRTLFFGRYALSTNLLVPIWIITALVYYGLVLLTTTLQVVDNGGCDPDDPTQIPLSTSDYVQVIVTTVAEFPGLVVAALLVDRIGRKPVMCGLLAICGGAVLLLLVNAIFNNEPLRVTTLFVGRASITGMFMVLYTYTPEVYGTSIRATAVGVCISFSRVGGMFAPFIGQALVDFGQQSLAFILFGSMSLAAAVMVLLLPVETKGASLSQSENPHAS